jgi:GNAT superfamily N-acetyltransferase
MTSEITIRTASTAASDVSGLTDLINQWDNLESKVTSDFVREKLSGILKNKKSAVLVAENNEHKIIAYVYLFEVPFLEGDSPVELHSVLVDKNYRGQGIGKLIMQKAEEWAKSVGYKKIILSSRIQLEKAHGMYEGLGFTKYKQSFFFSKKLG